MTMNNINPWGKEEYIGEELSCEPPPTTLHHGVPGNQVPEKNKKIIIKSVRTYL